MGTRTSRCVLILPKGPYLLQVPKLILFLCYAVSRSASLHSTTMAPREVEQQQQLTPIDLDDEELAAYAEECAALADFDDIPEEELFSWSDFEEPDDEHGYDMDIA